MTLDFYIRFYTIRITVILKFNIKSQGCKVLSENLWCNSLFLNQTKKHNISIIILQIQHYEFWNSDWKRFPFCDSHKNRTVSLRWNSRGIMHIWGRNEQAYRCACFPTTNRVGILIFLPHYLIIFYHIVNNLLLK